MSIPPFLPETSETQGSVDPAFAALLADPRMAMRRCPPNLAFADLRAAADRFLAGAPRPDIFKVEDLQAPGPAGPICIRLYRPSDAPGLPLIMFMHGGGFLFGTLETHDAMCRTLANESGAAVAAVDYRLAPEAVFPAPLENFQAALACLARNGTTFGLDPSRFAVVGDSAGGQLVAAIAATRDRQDRRMRHVGLLYPLLAPMQDSVSATEFREGYMLTGEFIEWAWEAYLGPQGNPADPRFDLAHANLSGFPPTTIVTAAFDPLRDEGEAFGSRLAGQDVDVEVRRFPGMIHGFAGLPQFTPQADIAIGYLARRIGHALFA